MFYQLSGYFLQILTPAWRKKMEKLNDEQLVRPFRYNKNYGLFSFYGSIYTHTANDRGHMYDVFGESTLVNVNFVHSRLEFTKIYNGYTIKYFLHEIDSQLKTSQDVIMIKPQDILLSQKTKSHVFVGLYGSADGSVSKNEVVAILTETSIDKYEIPEKFLNLSTGW